MNTDGFKILPDGKIVGSGKDEIGLFIWNGQIQFYRANNN